MSSCSSQQGLNVCSVHTSRQAFFPDDEEVQLTRQCFSIVSEIATGSSRLQVDSTIG